MIYSYKYHLYPTKKYAIVLFTCLLSACSYSPTSKPSFTFTVEEPEPQFISVADTVKGLKSNALKYQKSFEQLGNLEFYKQWHVTNTHTVELTYLGDLPNIEQQGFYIVRAEELYTNIQSSIKTAKTIIENLKNVQYDDDDQWKDKKQKYAEELTQELESILNNLQGISNQVAIKHIHLIEKMLDDNQDNQELVNELQEYLIITKLTYVECLSEIKKVK